MFLNVLKKFFGSTDERFLKKLEPIVEGINALNRQSKNFQKRL